MCSADLLDLFWVAITCELLDRFSYLALVLYWQYGVILTWKILPGNCNMFIERLRFPEVAWMLFEINTSELLGGHRMKKHKFILLRDVPQCKKKCFLLVWGVLWSPECHHDHEVCGATKRQSWWNLVFALNNLINPDEDRLSVCLTKFNYIFVFVFQTGSLQVLSQQILVDCSWGFGNNGCDGGEEWRAYEWIMKHGGIATTETYGAYMGMVRKCCEKLSKNSFIATNGTAFEQSFLNMAEVTFCRCWTFTAHLNILARLFSLQWINVISAVFQLYNWSL